MSKTLVLGLRYRIHSLAFFFMFCRSFVHTKLIVGVAGGNRRES